MKTFKNINVCKIYILDLFISEIKLISDVTMATGGGGSTSGYLYEEDDRLDERLLNQISKWILYHRLPSLARHLGISDAEITRIMIPSRTPEEQCFQVWLSQFNIS